MQKFGAKTSFDAKLERIRRRWKEELGVREMPGNVSSPLCVCENWKGYAVEQNHVDYDVLMIIIDNYMFRPLLAIFRLSSGELKVIYIYILRSRDGEAITCAYNIYI